MAVLVVAALSIDLSRFLVRDSSATQQVYYKCAGAQSMMKTTAEMMVMFRLITP
jgi:hypothetical protein